MNLIASLSILLAEAGPGNHPTVSFCNGSLNMGIGTLRYCEISTDSMVSTAIAVGLTLLVGFVVARKVSSGVPGKLQMLFELAWDYIRGLTRETVNDEAAPIVVPLALTIAFFILIANWLDFLPLADPVHPANADINQTGAMAVVVFIIVQVYCLRVQGVKGFFRRFTKPFEMPLPVRILFIPLNLIEELVKPVTLSLRLFGNIFAGILMIYLLGLLWSAGINTGGFGFLESAAGVAVLIIWKGFDVFFVGTIQAFIFMLLTVIYFGQAREGMEEHGHGGHAPAKQSSTTTAH